MNKDINIMAQIQAEKLKEQAQAEQKPIDAETADLARGKLFSLDVSTYEVKADPLR